MAKAKILDGDLKGIEFEMSKETIKNIKRAQEPVFAKIEFPTGNPRFLLNIRKLSASAKIMLRHALDNDDTWMTFTSRGCPGLSGKRSPRETYSGLKEGVAEIIDIFGGD